MKSSIYYFHMKKRILADFQICIRPNLKSCLFPIHRPGEIKNSHEPPAIRNFFLFCNLCLKRYMMKRFKKTSSWYNKNVTFYIFMFNYYVQFLCWFMVTWQWWLISIKVLSCVPIQIEQTNISTFSPIFRLTVSFADPLWITMYRNRGS